MLVDVLPSISKVASYCSAPRFCIARLSVWLLISMKTCSPPTFTETYLGSLVPSMVAVRMSVVFIRFRTTCPFSSTRFIGYSSPGRKTLNALVPWATSLSTSSKNRWLTSFFLDRTIFSSVSLKAYSSGLSDLLLRPSALKTSFPVMLNPRPVEPLDTGDCSLTVCSTPFSSTTVIAANPFSGT